MAYIGSRATNANRQLIMNIAVAKKTIIATSRTRSTEPNTMKSQSRSVSFVTRVIKLPVFFREKNDKLNR